jgi:hypothetical protein
VTGKDHSAKNVRHFTPEQRHPAGGDKLHLGEPQTICLPIQTFSGRKPGFWHRFGVGLCWQLYLGICND